MSLSIKLHRNGPLKNTDFLPLSDLICGILKSLLLRRLYQQFSSSINELILGFMVPALTLCINVMSLFLYM